MRFAVVIAAVLVTGLTGCSVSGSPSPSPAASTPATTTTTSSTAPPPTAADGTNVAACFDGTCEIAISGPLAIPLDRRFRIARLTVDAINPDGLAITFVSTSGGGGSIQTGVGADSGINGITIKVVAINGGTAVLRCSPSGK